MYDSLLLPYNLVCCRLLPTMNRVFGKKKEVPPAPTLGGYLLVGADIGEGLSLAFGAG